MSALLESLDEYLANRNKPEINGENKEFAITDLNSAIWAVRKVKSAQQKIDEATKVANEQVKAIKDWLEGVAKEQQQTIDYMQSKLRPYAEEQIKGTRKKSIKVLDGVLKFNATQPTYTRNDDEILRWSKDGTYTDYVKVTETVNWSALKKDSIRQGDKLVTLAGELVPGVVVTDNPDSFKVTFAADKEES